MPNAETNPAGTTTRGGSSPGRIQLALNVTDLAAAVRAYRDMFDAEPSKRRPGYATFAIADPPLKLVLFENPDAASPLNHVGVELGSTADVAAVAARFTDNNLQHTQSSVDHCCHAVQDKVWVDVPDVPFGAWEFYTVIDDDPDPRDTDSADGCCTGSTADQSPCCGGNREASR